MRKLVRQIKRELKTVKHCAICEEELSRVWRHDGKQRELMIAQFAQDNGFRLRFYCDGLCAIFDEEQTERRVSLDERFVGRAAHASRGNCERTHPCAFAQGEL
jgi:hypothetical protein